MTNVLNSKGLKILCLNGPPKSGKDTMAQYLQKNWLKTVKGDAEFTFERFSRPLKTTFAAIVNRPYNEFFEVEYYEANKDIIDPILRASFRDYQIAFSEKFAKKLYGNDIFARWLYARISYEPSANDMLKVTGGFSSTRAENRLIVIPDCGFPVEIEYLTQFYAENMILVRMHREGCDFKGDSRDYVYTDKCTNFDLYCDAPADFTRQRAAECLVDYFPGIQAEWGIKKSIGPYYTSSLGVDIKL